MAKVLRFVRRKAKPLRHLVVRRRFLGYGVGTGRSGTTSLARIFSPCYRTAHEAEADQLIAWILSSHPPPPGETESFVSSRDRRLWLEMESSQLLVHLLPSLLSQFPQARFVLTIRDPLSWLRSTLTHELTQEINGPWRRLADARFGRERYSYSSAEGLLARRGLYTLDGYLSYWAWHNATIVGMVPPSRLLVVRTDEISRSLGKLAGFLGVGVQTLNDRAVHSARAVSSPNVLAELDPDLVADKVVAHCRPLVRDFFPELAPTSN